MVIHRIEDTMELSVSVERHKETLAAAIRKRYSPWLRPGEELPDYALGLELAVRSVQAALQQLIQLDDDAAYALTELDLLRLEQDRLVDEELYPSAVSVRGAIDLAFGRKDGVHVHGIRGRTPRRAAALADQIRRTVLLLRRADEKQPRPKNPHAIVDRDGWIRMLEAPGKRLADLRREIVRRSDHGVPGVVSQKQAAMDAFDTEYGDALRSVTAAFKAARFDARSLKNLRPYYQRRRLSRRAREKRQQRAAAGVATPKQVPSSARDSERVLVPRPVAEWLEKHRLFGT